jgi:hypothetical protein
MRVLAVLPMLALLPCKSTSADDPDLRIKVRLESQQLAPVLELETCE